MIDRYENKSLRPSDHKAEPRIVTELRIETIPGRQLRFADGAPVSLPTVHVVRSQVKVVDR